MPLGLHDPPRVCHCVSLWAVAISRLQFWFLVLASRASRLVAMAQWKFGMAPLTISAPPWSACLLLDVART